MKNRIVISVRSQPGESTVGGRVKAVLAGVLLAAVVTAVLSVALVIGSVVALAFGILLIVAVASAIVVSAVRRR